MRCIILYLVYINTLKTHAITGTEQSKYDKNMYTYIYMYVHSV